MLRKITIAVVAASVASAWGAAAANAASVHHRARAATPSYWAPQPFGDAPFMDRYGLGYSNTARHDPTNTNGF
jgi:hypothetical protein